MAVSNNNINVKLSKFNWWQTSLIIFTLSFLVWELLFVGSELAVTKCVLLLIIAFCLYKGKREPRFFNPYYLFIFVPISLFIYDPTISSMYFVKLKNSTIWLACMNMIAFLGAVSFFKVRRYPKDLFLNKKSVLIITGWIFLFLSLIGHYVVALSSTLPLLAYPAFACFYKSKNWGQLIVVFLLWFLVNMNTLNKSTILTILILFSLVYLKFHASRDTISWKIITGCIAAMFIMYIAFSLKSYLAEGGSFMQFFKGDWINSSSEFGDQMLENRNVNWHYASGLYLPYMYFTTPWSNLQYIIDNQTSLTYGMWFFKPLLGWLQLKEVFAVTSNLHAYSNFNTFTFLAVEYSDFGFFGSLIPTIFLGCFVKWIYSDYCNSSSPLVIGCYALVAQATIEMFFSNHFFMQSYPFTIVLLCFLYRIAVKVFTF